MNITTEIGDLVIQPKSNMKAVKEKLNKILINKETNQVKILTIGLEYFALLISFIYIPFLFFFLAPEGTTIDSINVLYIISGSVILSSIWLLKNRILKKIIYTVLYLWFLLYTIIQYIYETILDKYFTLFDIYNLSEGTSFIETIVPSLTFTLILGIILGGILYLITMKLITIVGKNQRPFPILYRLSFLLIFISIMIVTDLNANDQLYQEHLKADVEKNTFTEEQTRYEKVLNFSDTKTIVPTISIYKYFFLDFTQFASSFITPNNSLENIDYQLEKLLKETEVNDYTGIYEGDNLVFILLESIDTWIIDEDTMPTLNNMMKTGMNFTNHYTEVYSGGSTQSTEFAANTGFYVPLKYNVYDSIDNNYKYSLPNLFNEDGYNTYSLHANEGSFYNREDFHQSWGYKNTNFLYDEGYSLDYFNDTKLLEEDVYDLYIDQEEKFMTSIITYSGHGPYINNSYCPVELNEEECYRYVAKITDDYLKGLIERLEQDNMLDNTTFVMYGDHYSYLYQDKDYIYSKKVDNIETTAYQIHNIPFVIWNNHMEPIEFTGYTGTTDILPTVANLFGLNYDANYYIGDDVFSNNYKDYLLFGDLYFIGNDKSYYNEVVDRLELNDDIIKTNYFLYR